MDAFIYYRYLVVCCHWMQWWKIYWPCVIYMGSLEDLPLVLVRVEQWCILMISPHYLHSPAIFLETTCYELRHGL